MMHNGLIGKTLYKHQCILAKFIFSVQFICCSWFFIFICGIYL